MDQKQFDAMLSDGETRLRRLKILYEQWFLGFERVEPALLRKEFEDLLALLKREQVGNTALRFRLQQLVQRHVTFSTHWRRVARQIEEGTYQRDLMRARRRAQQGIDRDNAGPELELSYDVELDDDLAAALEEVQRAADAATAGLAASPAPIDDKPRIDPAMHEVATARAVFQPPSSPPTAARPPAEPRAASTQAARKIAAPGQTPPTAATATGPSASLPTAARPPIGAWAAAAQLVAANRAPASEKANGSAVAPTTPRIRLPSPPALPSPQPSAADSPAPRAISPFALPATPSAKPAPAKPPPPPSAAKALGLISPPLTKPPANQQMGRPAVISPAASVASSPKPAANGALSNDDVQRIYKQYVDARKQNSERVDNVKFDSIEKTLRGMMPQLEKKHAGKKIDFEVVVKDGKVALKPIAR